MIKLANLDDLEVIESFDPFGGDRKEDIDEKRVFVFIKSGCARGFISMQRAGLLGRPYVQNLAVDPEFHRLGIASALLEYAEELSSEHRLFISTENSNTSMKTLLLKRNYKYSGKISGANLNGSDELYYFKECIGC